MEKIEDHLRILWDQLFDKTVITLKDIDEIKRQIGNAFSKIQRQRQRLENSRDMWKEKYFELKSESNNQPHPK